MSQVTTARATGPAYGGTPSDESVRQAIAALKARGLEVTLYPFVFMDCPNGYPWRGRRHGAGGSRRGRRAAAEVAAIFGTAERLGPEAAGAALCGDRGRGRGRTGC